MGIKDLWSLLTPYCERKPIYELQGKVVAIDLAGWVCESLNVVDYFVHPKQYLKNLFFRTCYLLLAGVTPVFVLEGKAPELKQDTITRRNALQFRGNKPREETGQSNTGTENKKGRTRFNYVLKECEKLLETMGLQCVQAPGEAEAFCAHLNMNGQVYGIISQDSDCFAYGAIRVFRNFSVSTQGNAAAAGGAVDIYDMEKICKAMDFGQNKIITMALLCGCDYCPGVEGVGRDAVIKLFAKYKNNEILERIRCWRANDYKYTELEIKVDDKSICSNCGHHGKTLAHARSGCSLCKTSNGCDSSLWKERRLAIKSELLIRKKALLQAGFPSEEIINEFLTRPEIVEKLNLCWNQPNLVRFVKAIGTSLQWTEIYCFQKFLPLLTRWLIFYYGEDCQDEPKRGLLRPDFIKKKRTPKGIPSYEIVWKDDGKYFECLIPDDQMKSYLDENPKGIETLFSTIEPVDLTVKSFPTVVEEFLSKQKKPKAPKKKVSSKTKGLKENVNDSLNNMNDMLKATDDVGEPIKGRKKKTKNALTKMDRFLIGNKSTPLQIKTKDLKFAKNCSTPKASRMLNISDLEDDVDDFNYSEIIKNIVSKPSAVTRFDGKRLKYDSVQYINRSQDDIDLLPKIKRSFPFDTPVKTSKRQILSDSSNTLKMNISQDDINVHRYEAVENAVDRFLMREGVSPIRRNRTQAANISYFFEKSFDGVDEFERTLESSVKKCLKSDDASSSDESDNCVLLN